MNVASISTFRPVSPDADWETIRARIMALLATLAGDDWTDHNAVEPGVTLAESAAWGLADLHYRTEERHFDRWPMEVRLWEDDGELHWHAALPPSDLAGLADRLAEDGTTPGQSCARELEPLVRSAASREEAVAVVADGTWGATTFSAEEASTVVDLLRRRLVRQVAQESTDLIIDVIEQERISAGPSASAAQIDAAAVTRLKPDLSQLWGPEIRAVVRRVRRRMSADAVAARAHQILAVTDPADTAALRADLEASDLLTAAESSMAMALHPTPPGAVPESWERVDGSTRLWPPHPLQALTCEPVTANDYARLARAAQLPSSLPPVRRAWAVPGRLPGVAWDGRTVGATETRAGTVTIVVEPEDAPADVTSYLRAILRHTIGSEVVMPHPTWLDDLDQNDPRRMICDEVGAAILRRCPVTLKGTIVAGVGADRVDLIDAAVARVGSFFENGRPESRVAPGAGASIEGPWPNVAQPADGWVPGESIRVTEVIQVIAEDPVVLGVEDLTMSVDGGPFLPVTGDEVPLAPDCVPVIADHQCLQVKLALGAECIDG